MTKKTTHILLIVFCIGLFTGCKPAEKKEPMVEKPQHTFSAKGTVREIMIAHDEPEFPEIPGYDEFTTRCITCHTLRYISIQPDFPRKTWEAEVKKMIEKYKAPIDSATAVKIVDYLAKVKGK